MFSLLMMCGVIVPKSIELSKESSTFCLRKKVVDASGSCKRLKRLTNLHYGRVNFPELYMFPHPELWCKHGIAHLDHILTGEQLKSFLDLK